MCWVTNCHLRLNHASPCKCKSIDRRLQKNAEDCHQQLTFAWLILVLPSGQTPLSYVSFPINSQYFRETILNEIRKARELYTGLELAAELSRIQQRLDNVECLSVDIVINLLLTYRDIQVHAHCATIIVVSLLSVLPRDRWRNLVVSVQMAGKSYFMLFY